MELWAEDYEGLRDEALALAPLVVDAAGMAAAEGHRATRVAQRRRDLEQLMVASPDGVDEVIAGVPCLKDAGR